MYIFACKMKFLSFSLALFFLFVVRSESVRRESFNKTCDCGKQQEQIQVLKQEMQQQMDDMRKEVEGLQKSVYGSKRQTRFLASPDVSPPDHVVFTVTGGSVDISHLGQNQPVLFPVVIENSGNAYDVRTGIFRASIHGVYLFSATLMNNPPSSGSMDASLTKNGKTDVFFTCRDNTYYDSCSATMAVTLQAGDEVWVKHTRGGEVDAWRSFTGVLISRLA